MLTAAACTNIEFDYNIDFCVDGKTIASAGTNGDKISMPKNPEKDGYAFEGWFWDDGEWEKPFTLNSILDQPIQDVNRFTVYAKWKSTVYYTVVFNANGGNGSMSDMTAAKDEKITLLNSFTPTQDYVFGGWNTKADGSGKAYANGESVINLCNAGETVTLYAQWHELERFYFTVIFDSNGGSGQMDSQTVRADIATKLNYNCFYAPDGKVFLCWNTKADGSGVTYGDHEDIIILCSGDESITLYAQWISPFCTIKYDANGGKGTMEEQKTFQGITSYLSRNSFEKDYHSFNGWNTEADGSGTSYANNQAVKDICPMGETVTLYAQWKVNDGVTFINSKNDLEKIRQNLNGVYVLTTDIDYQGQSITPLASNDQFKGTFDGNGHVIKNFNYLPTKINPSTATSGFFGNIGNSGHVCNLGLTGFTVLGFTVGAFADTNYGVIENCYADGIVNCNDFGFSYAIHAGGIVGGNHGIVRNCLFSGRISVSLTAGDATVGGVTGLNMLTTENCLCAGDVIIQLSRNGMCDSISYVSYDYYKLGVSKNNYYLSAMEIVLYKNDELSKCEISKNATAASSSKLDTTAFYTDTLNWDESIWDFSDLDSSTSKYPVLVKK